MTENKGIESFEDIDDLDLEALIVEGKEAVIDDVIEIYNIKTKSVEKRRIHIRPIPHDEWSKAVRATGKNSKKDLEQIVCAHCWLQKDGMPYELSKIKEAPKGIVTQVYEKIKLISGQLKDPFEEKYLDKLTDF
nr:hypothetical protein [uncultured Methanobacterium sp.]